MLDGEDDTEEEPYGYEDQTCLIDLASAQDPEGKCTAKGSEDEPCNQGFQCAPLPPTRNIKSKAAIPAAIKLVRNDWSKGEPLPPECLSFFNKPIGQPAEYYTCYPHNDTKN